MHEAGKTSAPLAGLRIAVTRAEGRGGPLAEALRNAGAEVTELPLTVIESLDPSPLRQAVAQMSKYAWVLLTSANAVHYLADALRMQSSSPNEASRLLFDVKLAVVGTATADAAAEQGWSIALVPERFSAEGLVDAMAERNDIEAPACCIHRPKVRAMCCRRGCDALGATVDVVPAYRSAPDAEGQARLRTMAAAGSLDLITVAAPSAVDALLAAVPAEHARRLPVACIGPTTARAARRAGFPVKVEAESATTITFVRSIVAAFAHSR